METNWMYGWSLSAKTRGASHERYSIRYSPEYCTW